MKWLESPAIAPFAANILITIDELVPFEASSSQVRALLRDGKDASQFLSPAILKYHQDHSIVYPAQSPPQKLEPLDLQALAPGLALIEANELVPEVETFESAWKEEENKTPLMEAGRLLGKGLQA